MQNSDNAEEKAEAFTFLWIFEVMQFCGIGIIFIAEVDTHACKVRAHCQSFNLECKFSGDPKKKSN